MNNRLLLVEEWHTYLEKTWAEELKKVKGNKMSEFKLCEEMGLTKSLAYFVASDKDKSGYVIPASDVEKMLKNGLRIIQCDLQTGWVGGPNQIIKGEPQRQFILNPPEKPKPVTKEEILKALYQASKSTWDFKDLISNIEKAGIE